MALRATLPAAYFVPRRGRLSLVTVRSRRELRRLRTELALLRSVRDCLNGTQAHSSVDGRSIPDVTLSERDRRELDWIRIDASSKVVDEAIAFVDEDFCDVRKEIVMSAINREAEKLAEEMMSGDIESGDSSAADESEIVNQVDSEATGMIETESGDTGMPGDSVADSIDDAACNEAVTTEAGAEDVDSAIGSALDDVEAGLNEAADILREMEAGAPSSEAMASDEPADSIESTTEADAVLAADADTALQDTPAEASPEPAMTDDVETVGADDVTAGAAGSSAAESPMQASIVDNEVEADAGAGAHDVLGCDGFAEQEHVDGDASEMMETTMMETTPVDAIDEAEAIENSFDDAAAEGDVSCDVDTVEMQGGISSEDECQDAAGVSDQSEMPSESADESGGDKFGDDKSEDAESPFTMSSSEDECVHAVAGVMPETVTGDCVEAHSNSSSDGGTFGQREGSPNPEGPDLKSPDLGSPDLGTHVEASAAISQIENGIRTLGRVLSREVSDQWERAHGALHEAESMRDALSSAKDESAELLRDIGHMRQEIEVIKADAELARQQAKLFREEAARAKERCEANAKQTEAAADQVAREREAMCGQTERSL